MLKELKQAAGLEGRLAGSILDQGDAVGAWQSDTMAVVVFPTAETLKQACLKPDSRVWTALSPYGVAAIASMHWMRTVPCAQVMAMADARREGLVTLINPQWQQGQVGTWCSKHSYLAALPHILPCHPPAA